MTASGGRSRREPPFVAQSFDFTCGPACLLTCMGAITGKADLSTAHEIDIWREATTVAPPGSSRHGLALAALRRGYRVRLIANREPAVVPRGIDVTLPPYYDGEELRRLLDDRTRRVRQAGVPEERRDVTLKDLEQALGQGEKAMVLTSTEHFGEAERIPHWIALVGREKAGFRYANPLDPGKRFRVLSPEDLEGRLGFGGEHEALFLDRPWWLAGSTGP